MNRITHCVYCGRPITTPSKEHIIHNALGGLYESTGICCPDCNELVGKLIDVPFTKTFNPIISQIDNFAKTNKGKSSPPCTGKAIHNGVIYDVGIKDGKVTSCPELSRKLKQNVKELDWAILSYDFRIDNDSFRSGMGKIAFNYALECGIPPEKLQHGMNVQIGGGSPSAISFTYPLLPFVALNPMDHYLELETETQLYHNLILFSQNRALWCYIDLFNTFQYYVLLSSNWDDEHLVYHSYLQLIQKLDRTVPKIRLRRHKYALIYADIYNVSPSTDEAVLEKRIAEAIQKESLKKDMPDFIASRLGVDYTLSLARTYHDAAQFELRRNSFMLYFDTDIEQDKFQLKTENFRQITFCDNSYKVTSYPWLLKALLESNAVDPKEYTHAKFERLNQFLLNGKEEKSAVSD
ncbi:MAG: HNH endonuclease [Firmicutes bacterium]|nr:HNH endonuclease [Bacillota bacterium]MDY6160775.1 HNH endonuclease [Candidatus Faecousia sp.]